MVTSGTPDPRARRRVLSVFLLQGVAGLSLMLWLTWIRREQTAEILGLLGDNAYILIALFIVLASALALMKFELTNLIWVSLAITSFISFYALLGPVITSWIAIAVVSAARWLALQRIGPVKTTPDDVFVELVKIFPGMFGTYGIPIIVGATLYEILGGRTPVTEVSARSALLIAAGGITMILTNNLMMFMPARAYGYSARQILRLDAIDSSIYLVTVPYAVIIALAYRALGWGAVLALAFTGAMGNFIARNLARTRGKSQQQLQRLASLTNIGKAISLRFTTDQLLMAIYTECRKVIDCSLFTIALVDETTNELSFELDVRDDIILPKDRVPIGEGLNSWVIQHHRPLLLGSTADELRLGVKAIPDTKATESWLGVPMIARDRVIGVISIESYTKNAFTNDDLILLTAIANQAAVAIENAQLYKDLEGLTYALEQRVMERTNELREANLRLMAADRSKNQFLANMSHELRTPLNSIIGFSSVLLESTRASLPARLYKFLENIHTAGNHLLELINDILDLSKIEAGKMELRPDEFDLRSTLAAVERVMKGFAADANVRIITRIDPNLPLVRLDEGRLKQILFNLLSNAVKFSPHGSTVEIAVRGMAREHSPINVPTVRIDVIDKGVGIPADELQRIFDEFYQTEIGRRAHRGGTGLGLSLTRNFVELHRGTIEVESTPGVGSIFTLYLPIDYYAAAATVAPVPTLHARGRIAI